MDNHKNKNHDDHSPKAELSAVDFGEPTLETLTTFTATLDILKQAALDSGEVKVIPLHEGDDPETVTLDGMLTSYSYNNTSDKAEISAHIYEYSGSSDGLEDLYQELEEHGVAAISIHITRGDSTIEYTGYFGHEPTIYFLDLNDDQHRKDRILESHSTGNNVPTDGSMRGLIDAINEATLRSD